MHGGAKSNIDAHRVYSAPTDRSTGIICDQTISLDGFYTRQDYPELLRRIRFKDPESGKRSRTRDLRFTKPLLYQLSYAGILLRTLCGHKKTTNYEFIRFLTGH